VYKYVIIFPSLGKKLAVGESTR